MFSRVFLASGLWVSVRYVAVALLGILTTAAFARLGTKELLGQYQFVLALLALASIFSLPGLNIAALKAVAQKKPVAVVEAVARSFRASLLAVPLLAAYAGYLYSRGQPELAVAVGVASLIFPFYYAPNTWYVLYEGQLKFQPVAIRTIAAALFATAGLLVGLYLHLNLPALIVLFLGISAIFSIIFYLEVRRTVSKQQSAQNTEALDVRYGKRVTIQKFAYTLSESLPPLAVSYLLGHAAVAEFQVANIFLAGVAGLIGALAVISLPKLFTQIDSDHRPVLGQHLAIGLLASVGYFMAVQFLFLPLYGHHYQESFTLAQWLTGLPLVISLRSFLVNYFTARDRNTLIIIVYFAANAVAFVGFATTARLSSFTIASAVYLYLLNILLVVPFIAIYNSTVSGRKN